MTFKPVKNSRNRPLKRGHNSDSVMKYITRHILGISATEITVNETRFENHTTTPGLVSSTLY